MYGALRHILLLRVTSQALVPHLTPALAGLSSGTWSSEWWFLTYFLDAVDLLKGLTFKEFLLRLIRLTNVQAAVRLDRTPLRAAIRQRLPALLLWFSREAGTFPLFL